MRGFTGCLALMGMMGRRDDGPAARLAGMGSGDPRHAVAQAVKVANARLGACGRASAPRVTGALPGYYTLDTVVNGKTAGMLSVNARNGTGLGTTAGTAVPVRAEY